MWRWGFRFFFGGFLVAVFVWVAYFSFEKSVVGRSILVPDLVGKTLDEAVRVARDAGMGFEVEKEHARYSSKIPARAVLLQDPGVGSLVKPGQTIRVVLSRGPLAIEVPDLAGMSERAAAVTLARDSLMLGAVSTMHENGGGDMGIVGQFPARGAAAAERQKVSILIDRGRRNDVFVMPDLVGRNVDAELARLIRFGFHPGQIRHEPYAGVPEGTILKQVPPAGYPVTPQETIIFTAAGTSPS